MPAQSLSRIRARDDDGVPLYHRVYVVLVQKILDGSFPSGQLMPSEDVLATSFAVSRVTVRKAMERLDREGMVDRLRGRGTFPRVPTVAPDGEDNRRVHNHLTLSTKTKVDLLDYGVVDLPAAIASTYGAEAGVKVLKIVRIRRDSRSPISHTTCYLSAELAPLVPRRSIKSVPISTILTRAGIPLTHYKEEIGAVLADVEMSEHLNVDVGAALLSITRRIQGEKGETLELLQAFYRPDRYSYLVEYSAEDPRKPWRGTFSEKQELVFAD